MSLTTTLAACDTNPNNNGPAGSDLPSTLDDQIRYALAFIAQLRDGAGLPVGMILQTTGAATPAGGFIKANGALLSRTTYAALFAYATAAGLVSEATWNASNQGCFSVGDGSTTFRIPDLRAMHLRGLDESRSIDTGRTIGSYQDHLLAAHAHGVNDGAHAHSAGDYGHGHGASADAQGNHAHNVFSVMTGNGGTAQSGFPWNQYNATNNTTDTQGNHSHNISVGTGYASIYVNGAYTGISIQAAGGVENRVRNIAYPFWIKY